MTATIPANSIVVGFDGSTWAELALDWAAHEASMEGRPLVLLNAVHLASDGASAGSAFHRLVEDLQADARRRLARADERVREVYGVTDIHHVVEVADPREALLAASKSAGMVVVGSRGLGPIRELLLGSVSLAVTKHASCPVVVMRPGRQLTHEAGVVVGVAGDERDGPVLDFAFRVADARRLPITLVHCFWDVVKSPDGSREVSDGEEGYDEQRALLVEAAGSMTDRYPSVTVQHLLSRGFADVQLIDSSRNADLIVLGHRRKPFLRELIYGSVAPRVVEHAHCPAAVVPVGEELDEQGSKTSIH